MPMSGLGGRGRSTSAFNGTDAQLGRDDRTDECAELQPTAMPRQHRRHQKPQRQRHLTEPIAADVFGNAGPERRARRDHPSQPSIVDALHDRRGRIDGDDDAEYQGNDQEDDPGNQRVQPPFEHSVADLADLCSCGRVDHHVRASPVRGPINRLMAPAIANPRPAPHTTSRGLWAPTYTRVTMTSATTTHGTIFHRPGRYIVTRPAIAAISTA